MSSQLGVRLEDLAKIDFPGQPLRRRSTAPHPPTPTQYDPRPP